MNNIVSFQTHIETDFHKETYRMSTSTRTLKTMDLLSPGTLLRLEGTVLLVATLAVYASQGYSWLLFAILFLAPDLAILTYKLGTGLGSRLYNLVHTTSLPLAVALITFLFEWSLGLQLALIWLAHIGMDRALAFGLKYPTTFKDTHLNRI
jgi:hypothetical protein